MRFKALRELVLAATPFAISGAVPARKEIDVLFPPFEATWLEWKEQHYKVGAHIRISSGSTLITTVVISGRQRSSFYDQPDTVHLDAAGRFLRRAESATTAWPTKHHHERRAYERAYDTLAYLNQPGAMAEEIATAQYRVPLLNQPTNEITTVLVDFTDASATGHRSQRNTPIRPLHEVRGHVRRYKSGKTSWVRPHTRGDAKNGTHIATYKVDGLPHIEDSSAQPSRIEGTSP